MAIDICIWDKCNNRCLMCTNPPAPWPAWPDGGTSYEYESVISRLEAREDEIKNSDSIYIAGGEPTIHPRFLDIWNYIQKNFPRHRLILLSNGRRFYYSDFAKEVLRTKNPLDIELSLHGANEQVHDGITQAKGSFKQGKEGLKNLLMYKRSYHSVGVRYVITKKSYQYIPDFLKLARKEFPLINRVVFVFWEVESGAWNNSQELDVSYKEVFPYLNKSISLVSELQNVRFYHFPLCTVPMRLWPCVWRTLPEEEVKFPQTCNNCLYKNMCLGVPDTYYEYRTENRLVLEQEIKPIQQKVVIEKDHSNPYHHPIDKIFL